MLIVFYEYCIIIIIIYTTTKHDPKRPKYKVPSNTDYRERVSHARSVYDISHTGYLAHGNRILKQEDEADTRIIASEYSEKSRIKERGHEEDKSQTRPNQR